MARGVGDIKYQWKKGSNNISNETENVLRLESVNESDSDYYVCYVSNEYGDSAVSNVVFLDVTSKHCICIISVF